MMQSATEEAEKNKNYTYSEFINDMPPLSFVTYQSPNGMWVFWSKDNPEEEGGGSTVKELIKSALYKVNSGTYYDDGPNILIQYWALKTTIGGRHYLTTTDQSFGLRRIERGLCDYRIHCMSLELNVDDDDEEKQEEFGGGVIGRVFKHKHLESTPNVGYYSTKDYPQRQFALKCGIRKSFAVSVFSPYDRTCYGVLELVDTDKADAFPINLYWATDNITKRKCLETYLPLELQIQKGTYKVLERINKALKVVCTTHQLPLAQIWIPCRHRSAMAYVDSSKKSCYNSYLGCTDTYSFICQSDAVLEPFRFNRICSYHYLRKGQGIVGKALLSHKPYFCRYVSQLPVSEYPLSHYARKYELTGCFAICVHSTRTKNHDYVLEFFLPLLWNIISGDPQTFLESLLTTVKKHLPGFEICSGEGPVEELCVEVLKISMMAEEAEKNNNYTPSQFIKDMPQLTFNTNRSRNGMWVFWSKDDPYHYPQTEEGRMVKGLIKSALGDAESGTYYCGHNILIQFWALKTTIGGRRFLTTTDQPFGLGRIERGLCDYRIHCMSLEFNVDDDDDDEGFGGGGVIGRVFKHKHLESTPNVGYYSTKDYSQREFALKCGIRRSLAVAVFEPYDGSCYGVLELVDTVRDDAFPFNLYSAAKDIFKWEYLETYLPLELQIEEGTCKVLEEINKALQVACTTHQLPLAQIWMPCRPSSSMAYFDSSEKSCDGSYLCCTNTFSSICQSDDGYAYHQMVRLNTICNYHYLRKGQGLVGKALLSHKPCFCIDVTQLPIAEYPLSHYAREYGLTGCFAICLHSTHTKNHDYGLEFFLPLFWNTISGDPWTFLESLLATVKKHLPGFEICSGEGQGEELRVEVLKISMNDELDSFNLCQATRIQSIPESLQNEREAVRNEVTCEDVIDNASNVSGVEQNDVDVTFLWEVAEISERENEIAKTPMNDEIATRLPPLPESLQNEIEVVQLSDDESTAETAINNESNVLVADAEQNNVAVTSLERPCRAGTSERKQRTTETSFSYEVLKQHFGKKQEDAAESLDVSRSTLKRECRKHGIKRWPYPKRKKVNHSTSKLKHVNEPLQGGTKGVPKSNRTDPSCSGLPPKQTTAAAHITPIVTESEDFVTVKANYRDIVIKFRLSYSSGKAELVENVTKRLPLMHGSFSIRYEDDEGDLVLIACDEDVNNCLVSWRSLGDKKTIRMFVDEPITNQAPSI